MANPQTGPGPLTPLVLEGWQHLQLQRPLAAWASWQRALRADPDDPAALKAVETLANADELPAAARAVYRFRTPADPDRRARWDEAFRSEGRGLDDLAAAAVVFDRIASEADDPDALLNLALCHAWLGRNVQAVEVLDRVGAVLAPVDPSHASDAWTLAEVLRLGAGAEPLADDFRYSWTMPWPGKLGPPPGLLARWPYLVPRPVPHDPLTNAPALDAADLYDWLDRPLPPDAPSPPSARDLPRVLATVVSTPTQLRLSTPDPTGLALLDEPGFEEIQHALNSARRERTPLALAWADAAIATFRYPTNLDPDDRAALARGAVERYYEDLWVHLPRNALAGLTPLAASRAASKGDAVARARLLAVVRFREQLGTRPTHAQIYQGYPFDRLRRRLGLIAPDEGAVDPLDLTCASESELDALDLESLSDPQLADAFTAAEPLRDDRRTARIAAVLARRDPSAFASIDPAALFAPLVRASLREGEPALALDWLALVSRLGGPAERRFTLWTAEIHARAGAPEAAASAYRDLLDRPESGASTALDAAETLLDNGYPEQALPFLHQACDLARLADDLETLRAALAYLDAPDSGSSRRPDASVAD